MNQIAKSPEKSFGFFRSWRRNMSFGLFAAVLGVSSVSGLDHPRETMEYTIDSQDAREAPDSNISYRRADTTDFSFSLSVDCLLSFGGAKQLNKMGLSKETYLPLEMGMKQGGGLSKMFMIGQRAPGEKEGGRITDGWGIVYDKGNRQYYMYSISTENRIPEDGGPSGSDAKPVPHIVATPLGEGGIFGLDDLSEGLRYAFGGMAIDLSYESSKPFSPLRINLTCTTS